MTKLLQLSDPVKLRRQFGLFDDFTEYADTQRFTKTAADAGSSVALDAAGVGGVLQLVTGATNNNEAYVESTAELFKFAADKPLRLDARVQYSEAATNAANVIVGLMDAPGANTLLDDGGGPKASYSGAVFFKEDGQTVWSAESSIGSSQTTTQLTAANSLDGSPHTAGGSGYQDLSIEFQPNTSTEGEIRFWINDVLVAKHAISFGSATEMTVFAGVKAGGANSETLNIDYMSCMQLR